MDEMNLMDSNIDDDDDQGDRVLNLFIEGEDFEVLDHQSLDDKSFVQAAGENLLDFYDKRVSDRLAELDKKHPAPCEMADLMRQAKKAAKNWAVGEFKRLAPYALDADQSPTSSYPEQLNPIFITTLDVQACFKRKTG
jgi:hypothetical protein